MLLLLLILQFGPGYMHCLKYMTMQVRLYSTYACYILMYTHGMVDAWKDQPLRDPLKYVASTWIVHKNRLKYGLKTLKHPKNNKVQYLK